MNKKAVSIIICVLLVSSLVPFYFMPMANAAPLFTSTTTTISNWITLCDAHPTDASYEVIGGYYEGGSIYAFKIGDPTGGVILVDGRMHGWEDIGTEIMYRFATWLLTNNSVASNRILDGNYYIFIPVVTNAGWYDGVTPERGNANTTNGATYGVDINRNFVTGFSRISAPGTASSPFHGDVAADQNETLAVRHVMETYSPEIYVNTHYGGGPWCNAYGANTTLSSWIKTRTVQLHTATFGETFPWSMGSGSVGSGMAVGDGNAYGANSWLWEIAANSGSPYHTGLGSDAYMHNVHTIADLDNWYFPHSLPFFMALAEAVEVTGETVKHTLTVSEATGGEMNLDVGEHLLYEGSNQTLIAYADTGYEFAGVWSVDGSNVSAANPYFVVMDGNHTVYPFFNVKSGSSGSYGEVSKVNGAVNQPFVKVNGVVTNETLLYGFSLNPSPSPSPTPPPRPEDWIEGYDNRVLFNITDAKISGDLVNFPVLLTLSSSGGTGDKDLTPIFDNLTSSARKWCITEADGVTEVTLGEVELWDSANEVAYVWVALNLTNGQDNIFYFYYDSTSTDNALVGDDPNDAATNNVWDSSFTFVHHLQGAAYTALDDSSDSNNDVASANGTPTYNYTGKVGNGVYLDIGATEYLVVTDANSLDGFSEATFESWFNTHTLPATSARRPIYSKYATTGDQRGWALTLYNNGGTYQLQLHASKDGVNAITNSVNWTPSVDTWYHIGIRWDSSTETTPVLYINGTDTSWTSGAAINGALFNSSSNLSLGLGWTGDGANGAFDEMRISNLDRGAAYMVANYNNQIDSFVTWGDIESL